jgi:hypothetical protein
MQLVIACARPGLIRGGVRHPKTATYLLHQFSHDQLSEMLAEPELAIAIGRPLTGADVDALREGRPIGHAADPDPEGASDASGGEQPGDDEPAGDDAPAIAPAAANPARKRARGRGA